MNDTIGQEDGQAVAGLLRNVMSRRSALGLMAGGVASAAFVAGAGSSVGARSRPGSVDSEAIVRMVGDQTTADMDPRTSTGQLGVISRLNIFTPLLDVDSASGEVTPLFLAEVPEEEDPQTFLIKIAPGQSWHDGTDVTAQDVKYTVDWLLDEENGSLFGGVVLDIVDSIDVVDEETLRIHLNRVSGSVLDRFSLITPVPEAIAERVGADEFKISPTGNGPFKFDSFVVDDSMTISRWEDYTFGPQAPVAQVKVSRIVEGSGRINALQGGQLEVDINVDPQLFSVLGGSSGIVAQEWDCAGYNAILLNAGSGPFADVKVRQALAHAINRDEIVTAVWNELAQPQVGPIPPANLMASNPVAPEFDPERSAALLEEAGVPGLEFELMQGIWSTGLTMVAVLQAQMSAAGFKVNVTTGDSGGLYNRVFDGDWEAFSMRGNTAIIGTMPTSTAAGRHATSSTTLLPKTSSRCSMCSKRPTRFR